VGTPPRPTRPRGSLGARRAAQIVASPSAAGLVAALELGPKTAADLRYRTGHTSLRSVTDQLRQLESHGLVARIPAPRADLWALTSIGRSLAGPLRGLRQWAEQYEERLEKAKRAPARKPTIIPVTR
jgi:DNA-binding HxlR family transcriptional regulator